MELPSTIKKAEKTNPGTMLVYARHKMGKTTILSKLTTDFAKEGEALLVNFEPGGTDYNDSVSVNIRNVPELLDFIDSVKKAGKPYKYIIYDTVTKLDEWSEIAGTFKYMDKPQGRKFNLVDGKKIYDSRDPNFETVHEMPNGYGYKYSREVMMDWYEQLRELAPYTIFVAHIKDVKVESRTGDIVDAQDINLTGKVKSILCTRVDAVARLVAEGDNRYLSFQAMDAASGARCNHLNGNILISTKDEDNIKTFWENIYI